MHIWSIWSFCWHISFYNSSTPSMKPTLTQWGGLSNYEVSNSASTREAPRIDATTFDQNKQIFLSTLPRTAFNTEVCSCLIRLQPLVSADAKADWPTIGLRCSTDRRRCLFNGRWGPHVLKARRALVKSWFYPLLVCKQDKVASKKG